MDVRGAAQGSALVQPKDATASWDLDGRVAVVTGGYGVLGGTIAEGLAAAGARVVVLGRRLEAAERQVEALRRQGAEALPLAANVLNEQDITRARDALLAKWNRVDVLINAAGGNVTRARNDSSSIFDVPLDAFDEVVRLNLHGTVIPSMIFGPAMADAGSGCIVNISSMAAHQAISGVMGYSAAKAAVDNLTRWLAVDLARRYGAGLRVNAIAPGFFVTDQNRDVLLEPDGSYTARASTIIDRTPMGRLGRPAEVIGAVRWLCSDAASFVTGVVIPVDGGFSAFSGV